MAEVYYTSNPSEYEKLEGTYLTERKPPGSVRGRDLSTPAFADLCVRGPLTPQTINSFSRFVEVYGARDNTNDGTGADILGEVWRAITAAPFGAIVVARVAAAAAAAAAATLDDTSGVGGTNILTITASSVGVWGNSITVDIEAATDGVSDHFNMRVNYLGRADLYQNIDLSGTNNNTPTVIGSDLGNLITVTKLAAGRPHNQAATALTGGTSGTVAASDYTTGLTALAGYDGVAMVLAPSAFPTPATVNGTVQTLAAAASDRIFLTWSGTHGNGVSTETAAIDSQITTRSDRIVWCFNSAKSLDPKTAALIDIAPHVYMASILSMNDVDVHPGSRDTQPQTAGVRSLRNEALSRADLIALKAKGICTLEKLSDGFTFRSGVTTSLVTGLTEITRRRMADFIQLSIADRIRYFVKKQNTTVVRAQIFSEVNAFLDELRSSERIVEDYSIDQVSVNTANARARGLEKLFVSVNLIDHILSLVLETNIGTGVVIERVAA